MTEPELPPGLKAGPEIVRIITVVSESGELMGISVTGRAPLDVMAGALKLALAQIEKLPPNASGEIIIKAPKLDEERKKARMN